MSVLTKTKPHSVTKVKFMFFGMAAVSAAMYFKISFTAQAPENVWSQPWQDACEETSIAMVREYYLNRSFIDISAKEKILEIFKIKEKYFGKSLDENADEIVKLINSFLPFEARVVVNPTLDDIRQEVDKKQPVIIPTYGKGLKNPHFLNGGPDYHVLIISGYDDAKKEFITQEPGTKEGENYRYSYDTLMVAMHDLMPNKNTVQGRKVVIFTSPELVSAATIDADGDGLDKESELKMGTLTYDSDTDSDGYNDGLEINSGYSPLTDESHLPDKVIIRELNGTKLYFYVKGKKHYIASLEELRKYGLANTYLVGKKFIDNLQEY